MSVIRGVLLNKKLGVERIFEGCYISLPILMQFGSLESSKDKVVTSL